MANYQEEKLKLTNAQLRSATKIRLEQYWK